mgnify:CR=1 FL=1
MKHRYSYVGLILIALLFQYCANPGPLVGGPQDEEPPVFVGSDPVKFSRNIQPRKVLMEFDEFLVLKELNQNLIISPPLNEDPTIKLKGKRVLIKNDKDVVFEDSTTYTYYFGNAICDLHEDNPISNFEFVFSTGPTLDSLSLRGKVLNAETLNPEETIYVCLYKNGTNDTIPLDSLPYFVRPYYIAKTNTLGEYTLNNLRYDDYLMFAVKDMNNNYYFDMPGESIAFIDSLLKPQEVYDFIPDTIPIIQEDTALMDSLWKFHSYTMINHPVDLFLFAEHDSIPKLLETEISLQKKIDFFFKYPVQDQVEIELLNDSTQESWYIKDYSGNKDTLNLWLTAIPSDTIEISLKIDTLAIDTLQFVIREPKKKEDPRRKRKKEEDKTKKKAEKEVIKFTSNVDKSHAFYSDIKIQFETPLQYANLENVVLLEDSIAVDPVLIFQDSLKRNLEIKHEWKESTNYQFIIPQEALIDIFEIENDSIKLNFKTTASAEYGNIELQIQADSLLHFPLLLRLMKGSPGKEAMVKEIRLDSATTAQFQFIPEGDYLIKAIEDLNHNGRWNTGSYGLKLAAERVFYFQKPITVKAGWDIEDTWKITNKDRMAPIIKEKKDQKKKGK